MFRKPHTARHSSLIKQGDVKKLRAEVAARFQPRSLDFLFPKHIPIVALKLSNGALVYARGDASAEPIFIDASGGGKATSTLVPTVHAGWRCADLLPSVTVVPPVVQYICNAADVMLPGCVRASSSAFASPAVCKKGALVFVFAAGNAAPFAVGELLIDFAHLAASGMTGKAVRVLHEYTDCLAQTADVPLPPGFHIVPRPRVLSPALLTPAQLAQGALVGLSQRQGHFFFRLVVIVFSYKQDLFAH